MGYIHYLYPHFTGCSLREIANEMEIYLKRQIENIPRIKVNLLFQYKKPEYINSSLGKEWDKWYKPYYRYDIYREQQDLLMKINSALGNRLLIVYASPAFNKVDDLVDAYISKKIINSSNFKKVEELSSHHRNTYTKAGAYSIACSETEMIKNFDLLELL